MGPTTYALCQKPVIGVAMWITSLCAFPPLFSEAPLALSVGGATISQAFKVRVDKRYGFDLGFDFPSVAARLQDKVAGSTYNEYCRGDISYQDIPVAYREPLGHPIPLKVVVRRKSDNAVVFDRVFMTLCVFAHGENKKWRSIGGVDLVRGDYVAEITNLESQSGLDGVKTYISLVAGHGK